MTHINRRNVVRAGGMGLIGAISAPAVARAQTRRWRMVTSWPKRLPGPGMSAERVAELETAIAAELKSLREAQSGSAGVLTALTALLVTVLLTITLTITLTIALTIALIARLIAALVTGLITRLIT